MGEHMTNHGAGTISAADTGKRRGYGRYPASITFAAERWMADVIQRMAVATRRSAGEILREALEGEGLAGVRGYAEALAAWEAAEGAKARRAAEGVALSRDAA
jgi:hypothetical protein